MSEQFELLVVGGGPAGLAAARGYREPVAAAASRSSPTSTGCPTAGRR